MKYAKEEYLLNKDKALYRAICSFIFKNHYSPSITELSDTTGISVPCIHAYLKKLQEKGFITFEQGISRSIVLCKYDYKLTEREG